MNWVGSVSHSRMMGEEEKPRRVVQSGCSPSLLEQSGAIEEGIEMEIEAEIEEEIEKLKNQIKEKRQALKQLHQEEDAKKQKQLTAAIAASGRSIDELIQMLEA